MDITEFENLVKGSTEELYNKGRLFDSYSYNEFVKKYSSRELKEYIIIWYIVGKNYLSADTENVSKLTEITDSIFNKIQVFYSPYVPEDYLKAGFTDTRKGDPKSSYECYKPYIDITNIGN